MLRSTNATSPTANLPSTSTNGISQRNEETRTESYNDINPDHLVLWRHPITTLIYSIKEFGIITLNFLRKCIQYKKTVFYTVSLVTLFFILGRLGGPQQQVFKTLEAQVIWCLYWIGLGVLSSIGLGSGLHTFVLYLGPHIARVTVAAYECGTLNFPAPPYPDKILCPTIEDTRWPVSVYNIIRKVFIESVLWGAGTALGELPPYYVARAARISQQSNNQDSDQEEPSESEVVEAPSTQTWMEYFIEKTPFFVILICASVPNPLFDAAGFLCGYHLVPFWKFFGATLIGKAIIKTHLQQLFVIIAFHPELIDKTINPLLEYIPVIGIELQEPLKEYSVELKRTLHGEVPVDGTSMIALLCSICSIIIVGWFLKCIIHELACKHHQRRQKESADRSVTKTD